MIEAKHITPPQHLWRWDGPYVWVGRWRIPIAVIEDSKVTLTREQLEEAAKIIWMMGFNGKTMEVQELLRRAASEFSHFKYLLPVEIGATAKKTWPGYWLLLGFGVLIFSLVFGLTLGDAVVRALGK